MKRFRITRLHRFDVVWTLVFLLKASAADPIPGASSSDAEGVDRKIASLDMIIVDVVGEKDLSKELRVSSSGTITFPFLGVLQVKGKTPAEVENRLRELLEKDYLVDPQVIVTVKEYRSRTVSVIGQVNKPGVIALPAEQRIDILQAIAQAGDLTKVANRSRIEISRKGRTLRFTLDELKKQADPEKKIWLEPDDVIFVHESFF